MAYTFASYKSAHNTLLWYSAYNKHVLSAVPILPQVISNCYLLSES